MAEVVKLADILRPPKPGRGSVADQADAWLAYLYSGVATDADREQFSRWLRESPAHAAAYASAEQLWRDLVGAAGSDTRMPQHVFSGNPVAEMAMQAPVSTVPAAMSRATPRRRLRIAAVAASLMLATMVGVSLFHDPASVRYASGTGEIKTVALPDGSTITLGGSSTIVARMKEEGGRHVELVSGRAYFDVAPDRQRPFFVKAAATEIRVVGTAFDVDKRPDGVQVAVSHGLVEVRDALNGAGERPANGAPPLPRRIEAGQKLKARLDGALSGETQAFDSAAELGWRSGHLHYVNTRLDTVVAEVNRYRDRKIVLADADLGALRVTASFQSDQTEHLLSGLATSYPVDIQRVQDEIRVVHR